MNLWIKHGRYAFLIRLDLILSASLWKEFQLLQILNGLSTKHLFKLALYENDLLALYENDPYMKKVCLSQFVTYLKCEILIVDTWIEYIKKSNGMVNLFFFRKFNVRMLPI